MRGRITTPEDLTKPSIWRAVARRLGQWHAVLPINELKTSATEDQPLARQLDVDSETKAAAQQDDITPIQPKQPGPNLWTVLQKWILALPATTDEERARRISLQKELERIVSELDDGEGIGEGGVRLISLSPGVANLSSDVL